MNNRDLEKECESILRNLVIKHAFLHPASEHFDIWSAADAKEVVADLIDLINRSSAIEDAQSKYDWGK